MRELDYTDERGRRWRVALPDEVPDAEAPDGIPIGPPPIADELQRDLGLPDALAVRLHNELHARRLYRRRDVRNRPHDVQAALQAALRLDVATIVTWYDRLERLE